MLVRDGTKAAKPWLTVVLDDYSRAVAGYFLSFEAPSSMSAIAAGELPYSNETQKRGNGYGGSQEKRARSYRQQKNHIDACTGYGSCRSGI
jgi:transposase InsO family protein